MIRIATFGMISVLGALIDFALTWALVQIAGIGGTIALGLSMIASGTIVYALHQKLTFSDLTGQALHARRWRNFLATTILVYLLRAALLALLTRAGAAFEIALASALVLSFVLNYMVSRFLVFRRTG